MYPNTGYTPCFSWTRSIWNLYCYVYLYAQYWQYNGYRWVTEDYRCVILVLQQYGCVI